ncbi:hypothetical protein NL676_025509 [Syzygium grande]|nr:hypothetical protein NL676_025509 [Syzygium grande]
MPPPSPPPSTPLSATPTPTPWPPLCLPPPHAFLVLPPFPPLQRRQDRDPLPRQLLRVEPARGLASKLLSRTDSKVLVMVLYLKIIEKIGYRALP